MIQLSAAGKRYGHKLLFEGADWMITPRDRVGLVGANGTGKSTVMKILAGLETLDYGSLSTAKGNKLWTFDAPEKTGCGPSIVDHRVLWGYGFMLFGGGGDGGVISFSLGQ